MLLWASFQNKSQALLGRTPANHMGHNHAKAELRKIYYKHVKKREVADKKDENSC